MATYNPAGASKPLAGSIGNAGVYFDQAAVSANIANADVINLCRVPAGTAVTRVVVKNPDLDSGITLTIKLGFAAADGSSLPATMSSPDVAVAAAGATTWQAAATTTYEIFPPYVLEKDCFLQAVAGAAGVGTGTIYAKVEGEVQGSK